MIFKQRLANFEILFYIAQIYKSFVASLVEDFLIVHSHHEIAVELREFLQVYLPPLQGLTLANTYQLYNKCICDSVVVKYLQEHGFESIANKVLQIRGESGNSELELSNIVNKFNLSEEQQPREPYQWTTLHEKLMEKPAFKYWVMITQKLAWLSKKFVKTTFRSKKSTLPPKESLFS